MKYILLYIALLSLPFSLFSMNGHGNLLNQQEVIIATLRSSNHPEFIAATAHLPNQQLIEMLSEAQNIEAGRPSNTQSVFGAMPFLLTGGITIAASVMAFFKNAYPDTLDSASLSPCQEPCAQPALTINTPLALSSIATLSVGSGFLFYGSRIIATQWNRKQEAAQIVSFIQQRANPPALNNQNQAAAVDVGQIV